MKWHRWAGLAIAAFVLLLCTTGIVLNHGGALGLAQRFIHSSWLLDLYGIPATQEIFAFEAGGHWASRIGERVFFDDRELAEQGAALAGMVRAREYFVIGLADRLLLLAQDGQLVETLRAAEGVPAGVRRIGAAGGGRVAVEAGGRVRIVDPDSMLWEDAAAGTADWAEPAPAPPSLAARLNAAYRMRAVSIERVLLDVHSGRIVRGAGTWLMDAVAMVLVSLVVSGLWIWIRR
jgi:hypothetical protein